MKQTILVTGGTGFIGSHTTVELQQAGYNVVIVDNLSNSKIEVLDGIEKITGVRPAFEQVDLRDKAATEAVFQKYPDIQGIIHFAASKAVGESVQKPLLYYRNNVVSLVNLLELMPQYHVKGIIFSSSCRYMDNPSQRTCLSPRMLLTRRLLLLMATPRKSTSRLLPTISTVEPM